MEALRFCQSSIYFQQMIRWNGTVLHHVLCCIMRCWWLSQPPSQHARMGMGGHQNANECCENCNSRKIAYGEENYFILTDENHDNFCNTSQRSSGNAQQRRATASNNLSPINEIKTRSKNSTLHSVPHSIVLVDGESLCRNKVLFSNCNNRCTGMYRSGQHVINMLSLNRFVARCKVRFEHILPRSRSALPSPSSRIKCVP